MALTKVTGFGIGTIVDDVVMTSDDPTITMTDSSGTNDIATIQATSGALIVTARDGSADGEIIFKKTDGSATDETMRIDAAGAVRVKSTAGATPTYSHTANGEGLTFRYNDDSGARAADIVATGNTPAGATMAMRFFTSPTSTDNAAERMRIDSSGKILIGKTVAQVAGDGVALYPDGTYSFTTSVTSTGPLGYFYNEGSTANGFRYASFRLGAFAEVGTITTNGSSSVSYNTSSDYRLKNNVTYDWDATTRLKQLKPARFNFIVDADTTVDGFLAHEVQDIVPEAITGTHNEVEIWTQQQIDDGDAPDDTSAGDNKLDGDGNTVPVMQGIDQSKIVPLLCKTILELEARITALETA